MAVSLSGLDLSWLKKPARPKRGSFKFDAKKGKVVTAQAWAKTNTRKSKRSDNVPLVNLMPDAAPYINVSTRTAMEITSRSQQREFEKRTGLVQVGNDFKGQWVKENNAKKANWKKLAKGHATAPEWV